jgi:rhomboid protease GluP
MRMSDVEPPVQSGPPAVPHESFCTYLAKQFIAKKGFELAHIPEVERLRQACDIVLTRSDGYTLSILAMVDREARPGAVFGLGVDELRGIGESCLKYTGTVHRNKMPVSIGVVEAGPGSPEQQPRLQAFKRSSLRAKIVPFAMTVDTVANQVWTSTPTWFSKGPYYAFVEKLLTAPREDVGFTPPVVATAPPSSPVLTLAILAVLVAVFAAELVFGIGPWTKLLQPTNMTLIAFGGIMKDLVLQSGEWYRLLAAPFLHVDATHITMNAIALLLAGSTLEPLIGRAWFGAVYVVGALTGSLLSLALNPPLIIAVGASGAIMGLFAAMLVLSLHFPAGTVRTALQMRAIYVLIPSLLPLAGALNGEKVDYAAHFGGAIGGAAMGLILLAVWSRSESLPSFRPLAAAVAVAGVLALVYPAMAVVQGYPVMAFTTQLIPAGKLPKTGAEMQTRSKELAEQYPRDPRPHYFRAADLLDAKDFAGAEREARAGLAEEDRWRTLLPAHFGNGLRILLAIAIDKDHHQEALETARQPCAAVKDGPMRKWLDARKLCGT